MKYTLPTLALAALAITGCSTRGSLEGRLVDGLTGDPVSEMRILLKAEAASDLTCQIFEATTDAEGRFLIEGTCADTVYHLESTDETWQIEGPGEIVGGTPSAGAVDITAWHAPAGTGVYLLTEGELKPVRTASDLDSVKIWETDIEVKYPEEIPSRIPRVADGTYLLLTGESNVNSLKFKPLVKAGKLRFGDPDHYFDMEPWSYIGYRFESKTEYETVEVKVDAGKVTKAGTADTFMVAFYSADALPDGRYALLGDKDRRTYIIDFGTPTPEGADGKEEKGGKSNGSRDGKGGKVD